MRLLVTGSHGFIGRNIVVRLREQSDIDILEFTRGHGVERLGELVAQADGVVHLAGENRATNIEDYARVNTGLTEALCNYIQGTQRDIPLILASSTQAEKDTPYGISKRAAEAAVERFAADTGNPAFIYRLPGVFGKWCKPNYNSVVATFCYNIANDLPIQINDPSYCITLAYIDDVVVELLAAVQSMHNGVRWGNVTPQYSITVGKLAAQILAFKNCRTTLVGEPVGSGLTKALYATYVSYLPPGKFAYNLPQYGDERGAFVEMLKTVDAGQFSYFTAHPGVTRGEHYHHSKTEKFLVIKGTARFRFRHLISNEYVEIYSSGHEPKIIDTIPGWVHDITNVGDEEMVVMLWANEIFDRERPDTFPSKV